MLFKYLMFMNMKFDEAGGEGGAGGGGEGGAPEFAIPAEHAGKEHYANIKSQEELYAAFDNVQTMIGKRPAGIPQENASSEEWSKFYTAVGKPESTEGYAFEKIETYPEGMEHSPEREAQVKSIFHEANLTPAQAKLIESKYTQIQVAEWNNHLEANKVADQEFEKISGEVFGTRKEEALGISKKLLNDMVPEKFKEHVAGLDNETLVVLASVLDQVNTKYISEDGSGGKDGSGGGAGTDTELRAEAVKLMSDPKYKDTVNFPVESAELKRKVDEIYSKVGKSA